MKKSTLQRPFSINLAAKATIFALTTLCALEHAMADESKQFDNFESYAGTGMTSLTGLFGGCLVFHF